MFDLRAILSTLGLAIKLPKLSVGMLAALANLVAALLGYADPLDEKAFRAWMTKIAEAFVAFTAETGNTVDDALSRTFARVVESDEAWSIFYGLITESMTTDRPQVYGGVAAQARAQECGEVVGFGAPEIMAVADLVIRVLEMFRR